MELILNNGQYYSPASDGEAQAAALKLPQWVDEHTNSAIHWHVYNAFDKQELINAATKAGLF